MAKGHFNINLVWLEEYKMFECQYYFAMFHTLQEALTYAAEQLDGVKVLFNDDVISTIH